VRDAFVISDMTTHNNRDAKVEFVFLYVVRMVYNPYYNIYIYRPLHSAMVLHC